MSTANRSLQLWDGTARHCPELDEKTKATMLASQRAVHITRNDVSGASSASSSLGGARKGPYAIHTGFATSWS